uniref:N-acetylglucosaminylphosphatidylinositol deacetylase n=1 Tax=Schistosoma japonicum TaxID=6182 RepID=Q5D8W3_SCHJA|nr:SJCHGC08988 protein [Schistosoma japonicum]
MINQAVSLTSLVIVGNILTFVLWLCLLLSAQRKRKKVEHPVLVVTAHPDDESMFFAPTILNLVRSGCKVDLLCCTTGNYDGRGHERKLELIIAMRKLGIRRSVIIDSDKFEDNPNSLWPKKELVSTICRTCHEFRSRSVITFDDLGVSGHKNHCVLGKTLREAYESKLIPQLYRLQSVSFPRKYCFLIDLFISILSSEDFICSPFRLMYVPYFSMMSHKSQLVWFRWLYMYFSVYMYKNCIVRCEHDNYS